MRTTCSNIFTEERNTFIVPEKISISGREKKSGHERVSFFPANKGVSRGREKKLGSKVNGGSRRDTDADTSAFRESR